MSDELKFTPDFIAKCRKSKQYIWVFPEAKAALDEIEQLQKEVEKLKLAESQRDAAVSMVERLIEAGQLMMMAYSAPYYDHIAPRENFNDLIAEWSKEHGNVT